MRSRLYVEQHDCLLVGPWPLDANLPGTVRRRAIGAQIAAEVDEKRGPSALCVGSVDRILLSDPAKIQLHFLWQYQAGRLPLNLFKAHQR
jgi:hypothetical protein